MRFFTLIAAVIFTCSIATGAAVGQTATPTNSTDSGVSVDIPDTENITAVTTPTETPTETPTPEPQPETETDRNATAVVGGVRVVGSGMTDDGRGYLDLALPADHGESVDVTVYDAGWLSDGTGGEPDQTKRTLDPGDEIRVGVDVTKANGQAAVAVSVEGSAAPWGTIVSPSNSWFDGPPTWSETRLAALGGFAGGVSIVMVLSRRELDSEHKEVRRIL